MSLRARIALLAAGAVAIAVLAIAGVAFAATRGQLRSGIDRSLVRFAGAQVGGGGVVFDRRVDVGGLVTTAAPPDELQILVRLISAEGAVDTPPTTRMRLPLGARDLAVARAEAPAFLRDVSIDGEHFRMITAPVPSGAIQVARSLAEVDSTLRGMGFVLLFVVLGGVGIAAGLGLVVARGALRPVERLTAAAEDVARTQDLDAPIVVDDRRDEIGRLASSFNAMLRALKESRTQQQRLVADASHELRTPLTSLRTNIEVLARNDEMDPMERSRILSDLKMEMRELSDLVGELVDLATASGSTDEEPRDVRLDEVVGDVIERARRRSGRRIDIDAVPTTVNARPGQLIRAVANIVDNACKFDGSGEAIDVRVVGGVVEVRDWGPGIDAGDVPYVFDRFFRSPGARSLPGSGLGLAIVKQFVESHGGRVWANDAPGGGACVGFALPEVAGSSDVQHPLEQTPEGATLVGRKTV